MRRLLPIPLLAALALIGAGCGSNSGSSSSSTSTPAPAPASTGSSASAGGGAKAMTVVMKNIQFSPKTITAKVGQKITWQNMDSVDHNVTAQSGASFKSQDFGQGGTFSFTPTKAGTIKYSCTLHPGMDATIVVK